jgi:ERCC4-type nuclease
MMKELDLAVLMLEGKANWTTDGQLVRDRMDKRNAWTRAQHRNYLHSVQMRGIHVIQTDNIGDSIDYLMGLQLWTNKADHNSLDTRPGPTGTGWGRITNVDYQRHLLMSLPGIGVKQANLILDTIGLPLILDATVEELMTVPGVGKKRAERILRVFDRTKVKEVV